MEKSIHETIENIIDKIKVIRKEKGYSLENMADELNLSVSAYSKIKNKETKLTFERFLQIQRFLEVPINKLLQIQPENIFNLNVHPNGEGYQANEQHLYKGNQKQTELLINKYEELIKSKDEIISLLKKNK